MKTLRDYILEDKEKDEETTPSSTSVTFDFDGLEDSEDVLKSFEDNENCQIDDKKVTIEVTQDNYKDLSDVKDILQDYTDKIRSSPKRSSDEKYAQLTKKFKSRLNDLKDAISSFANTEEE